VFDVMTESRPKPTLTAAETEARRLGAAIREGLDGRPQAAVADSLGAHPVTVAERVTAYRDGGEASLAATPVPGRPRFRTAAPEAEGRGWLFRKRTAFGFRTDLWTVARVAQLIRDRLGGAFHPNSPREWLSTRGCSPPAPIRRPKRRGPQVIDAWLGRASPAVQKKSPRPTPTSC
jgi:transposase